MWKKTAVIYIRFEYLIFIFEKKYLLFYFIGIGCAITMIGLGVYMYFKNEWESQGIEPMYTYIPVACIFIFIMVSKIKKVKTNILNLFCYRHVQLGSLLCLGLW